MNGAGGIEIYIGNVVEPASERVLLESLVDYFRLRRAPALIFMNVHLRGRQIDAIVITGPGVLVIEAKGYNKPVRGARNGPWEVSTAGGWKPDRNLYDQTVSAAYALRDAMRDFTGGAEVPYPHAALMLGSSQKTENKAR